MELSAQQKAALVGLRQTMMARSAELQQERRALEARLRASTHAMLVRGTVLASPLPTCPFAWNR